MFSGLDATAQFTTPDTVHVVSLPHTPDPQADRREFQASEVVRYFEGLFRNTPLPADICNLIAVSVPDDIDLLPTPAPPHPRSSSVLSHGTPASAVPAASDLQGSPVSASHVSSSSFPDIAQ